ncbi:hypothetical protein BX285_6907 [Streptomyces sp. 1114.5]|uniref:hypothetical protein n=1 Tax=Streptomyces sp. 1114.5 TaxID=1938830 RepID=UPI000EAF761A|nr:hypothetical protein [Streptomyces sp. 1114.5]RKT09801.1 hypothetical protein BX285_6907 [Streptomyces sp. 1114.5]
MDQQPPQVRPIDRSQGYDAYLKVIKVVPSVDDSLNPAMPPTNVIRGFVGRVMPPGPAGAIAVAEAEAGAGAGPATGTTGAPSTTEPSTAIMDGPGGMYGPSFSDPAPWACGGAPTPGCLPPPSPAIGGRR